MLFYIKVWYTRNKKTIKLIAQQILIFINNNIQLIRVHCRL